MEAEQKASQTRLERWRPGIVISVFFWLIAAGFAFVAIPVFVATATSIVAGIAWVALSLALIAFFVGLTTTYVDLYPDCVELGGWLRRSKRVPLAQLKSVTPGNSGLEFDVGPSGGAIGPALVGAKGLATRVLNIRMRGDRIAERIMLEVERVRSDTRSVEPPASQ